MNSDSESRAKMPKWLKRIQENSWEAEILISGGAVYILAQIGDYAEALQVSLDRTYDLDRVSIMPVMFQLAIFVLMVGFIIHLVLRGFWAGMISLNFTYPKGIKFENLSLKGKFQKMAESGRESSDLILSLEKMSGVIFGFTYLVFLMVIGVGVIMVVGVTPTMLDLDFVRPYPILGGIIGVLFIIFYVFFLLTLILSLIDLLTFGWLKSKKWTSKIYYPFYRFFSIISLSFLYRNLYYTLISNVSRKKRYIGLFVFSFIIFLNILIEESEGLGKSKLFEEDYHTDYYGPIEEWDFSHHVRLENKRVDNEILTIYWNYDIRLEENIIKWCTESSLIDEKEIDELPDTEKKECIFRYFEVFIDGKPQWRVEWQQTQINYLGFPMNVMTATFDISQLDMGDHKVSLRHANSYDRYFESDLDEEGFVHIPFSKI